ncbi:MAG: hypothetical protein F6K55_33975 [Moorea sp. SIO4A3]|nr:hypothetical protein [Moorena sp. SIO4A3]
MIGAGKLCNNNLIYSVYRTNEVHRIVLILVVPCSLFPIPYSLFPVPCSLFPIPYSLFPIPYFLFLIAYSMFKTSDAIVMLNQQDNDRF